MNEALAGQRKTESGKGAGPIERRLMNASYGGICGTRIPIDNTKRLRSPTAGVDACRMRVG